MRPCVDLPAYVAAGLAEPRRSEFEHHLLACPQCREQVEEWRQLRRRVEDWAEHVRQPEPTPQEAALLVARAYAAPRRPRRALWLTTALAGGVAIALAVLWPTIVTHAPVAPPRQPVIVAVRGDAGALAASGRFATDAGAVVAIGGDRIGLGPTTAAQLVEANERRVRLRLSRGRLAAAVAPRALGELFEVEAGGVRVCVVGTRFEVALLSSSPERVAVRVSHGTVVVRTISGKERQVEAGQAAEVAEGALTLRSLSAAEGGAVDAALASVPALDPGTPASDVRAGPEEPAAPTQPPVEPSHAPPAKGYQPAAPRAPARQAVPPRDLDGWRSLVMAGSFAQAEAEISAYLRLLPEDVDSWLLLADCRRKRKDWVGAVAAYRAVIAHADPARANAGRYEAAALLMDRVADYAAAAELLRAYLTTTETPRLLEEEAAVRLAQCQLRLGERDAARAALKSIVVRYPGTAAALRARELLESDLGDDSDDGR